MANDTWQTLPEVFKRIQDEAGVTFTLNQYTSVDIVKNVKIDNIDVIDVSGGTYPLRALFER